MRMKRFVSWAMVLLMVFSAIQFSLPVSSLADSEQVFALPVDLQTVGVQAFSGNTSITVLDVPDGVKSIESEAFEGCTGLTDVFIRSRDVVIADDAFDNCDDIVFYTHENCDAMVWAMAHGYKVLSLDEDSDHLAQFSSMLAHSGFDPSMLQSSTCASKCLIVRTPSGMERLPDISAYNPIDIFRSDEHLYYVQFNDVGDTEDCYAFLKNGGIMVEPDRIGANDDVSAQSVTIAENWGTNDVMGFDVYAPYVKEHSSGSVTIAVVDSGVAQNAWGGKFSGYAVSFVGGSPYTDSARHGSKVASIINDCVGNNRDSITLLPIRVVNSNSMYRTSVIIEGIKYAADHGANIINLSLGWDINEGKSDEIARQIANARAKGIMIVAAGGNGSGDVMFPAACDGVFAVSALAYSHATGYSVRSRTGSAIDYTAPGMYLSSSAYPAIDSAGDSIGTASTSFAAPQITAALALISLDSTHTGSAVSVLNSCCEDLGSEGLKSSEYGNGLPRLNRLIDVKTDHIEMVNADGGEIPVRLWLGDTGNAFTLGWNTVPTDATDQVFTATSDDESIVSCEQTGNSEAQITAKAVGTAKITIENSEALAEVEISVAQPVTEIIVLGSKGTMYVGKTAQLAAAVMPQTENGWVTGEYVPSGAQITDRAWSYREYKESTSPSLDGWTRESESWEPVGTGSRDYATFPSTYSTSSEYYKTMRDGPYTAYDNGSTKREVTDEHGGWVYWHWMYSADYLSGTTRVISDRSGTWNTNGETTGGYSYKYFYDIKSAVSCPFLSNTNCCGRNQPSYNCKMIIPADADKSNGSGLGTDRFFRIEYFTSTYTDYRKVYRYYRDVELSPVDPGDGFNISGKTEYVKYDNAGVGATDASYTWASTNEDVAVISESGLVTAKAVGSTVITCTANDGFGTVGELPLSVIYMPDAEDIVLTAGGEEITDMSVTLAVGETLTIEPHVRPDDAAQEWRYSVLPKDVVTVSDDGQIKALSTGAGKTATIMVTASSGNNVYTGLTVEVVVMPETLSVSASKAVLDINQTAQMTAFILPTDASNQPVSWRSLSPSVATVNASGLVTAASPGTVEIVGTTVNGITDSVTITVRYPILVSFDACGGTCSKSSMTAYKGFDVGSLPVPVRDYCTFDGWYTASNGGIHITESSVLNEDTVLYAHWTGFPYTVIFDANGGECDVPSLEANAYKKVGPLPAAAKDSYSFTGWFTSPDADEGTEITPDYIQDKDADLTVYAHWSANPYKMNFNTNLTGAVCDVAYKMGSVDAVIGVLPEPVREYYTFTGWFTTRTGGIQITADYKQSTTDEITVYAHWEKEQYTVFFDANGGDCEVDYALYPVDTEIGELPAPVRENYVFDYWYYTDDVGKVIAVSKTYKQPTTADLTVIAHWTPMPYTITLDANGGSCTVQTVTGEVDTPIGELPDAEREYYSFDGWYTTKTGNEKVTEDYVHDDIEPVTVYARWTPLPYTMTFDSNSPKDGAVTPDPIQGKVDTPIGTLPAATLDSYDFLGWFTAPVDGAEITKDYCHNTTDTVTVYAHWRPGTYTVTLNVNADNAFCSKTSITGIVDQALEELRTLPDPTRPYYYFKGWYTASSGGTRITGAYVQSGKNNFTVYAQWEPMEYSMSFNVNGKGAAVEPSIKQFKVDTAIGTLPTPTRPYYYFDGWYTSATGGTAVTAASRYHNTSEVTVYAHWSPYPFTVTFNTNLSGAVCSTASKTCYVDTAIGTLPTPTKDYYDFAGWFTEASGGTQVTASKCYPDPKSVTLYAHWNLHPEIGWVLEKDVPIGAQITQTSWSYRMNTQTEDPTKDGWVANGSYWEECGSGTTNYATFPSGFKSTHVLATTYARAPYQAEETATTKRVVTTTPNVGYIYWHWMYNVTWDNTIGRSIASKEGKYTYQDSNGETSKIANYCYFFAFASTVNCPSNGTTKAFNRPKGATVETWNCSNIIRNVTTEAQRNSNTSGVGCNRFYRFSYGTSSYTDYKMIFKYYCDVAYAAQEPDDQEYNYENIIITDKVKYVKYRVK